jgi:enolase-phosphatase E1
VKNAIAERNERNVTRAILLDIEGTTTPIAFVYDVLFPYARAHFRDFLRDHPEADAIAILKREWVAEPPDNHPPLPGDLATYIEWLMDRDRKSPGLKALQGLVWQRGYRDATLKGEVYADVPPALERWRRGGIKTAIYSSGSVLAQRLLFSTTAFGDLTPLLSGFFDTSSGIKTSSESYERIAAGLECSTRQMLFVSDLIAELDAARAAGCEALLCVRPATVPIDIPPIERIVHTFDEIP